MYNLQEVYNFCNCMEKHEHFSFKISFKTAYIPLNTVMHSTYQQDEHIFKYGKIICIFWF